MSDLNVLDKKVTNFVTLVYSCLTFVYYKNWGKSCSSIRIWKLSINFVTSELRYDKPI